MDGRFEGAGLVAEHYFHKDGVTLYTGDAAAGLAWLPGGSADCVVTSAPRWRNGEVTGKRGQDLCIGREPTAQGYVERLRSVFAELGRVVRDTGTVWLNVGTPRAGTSVGQAGMPWRVVFALQRDGWLLRNAVVWRRSQMAAPIEGRLSSCYETIFLLTKKPRYYFDSVRARSGAIGDVWLLGDAAGPGLSAEVAARCISAGCPAGGVVLDPFSGAAASGVVARRLGRAYVGIDVDAGCHADALRRFGLTNNRDRSAA